MRLIASIGLVAVCAFPSAAAACPFCEAIGQTMAEEMAAAEISALAKLVRIEQASEPTVGERPLGALPDESQAVFELQEVFKGGGKDVAPGLTAKIPFSGSEPVGSLFLLNGFRSPDLYWSTPVPLPGAAGEYIRQAVKLPKEGPERLKFFFNYLQHAEPLLDKDAYDEFAKAPYDAVKPLAPQLDRQQLWKWIDDPQITAKRKRLYYLLLSLCGDAQDRDRFEQMLRSRSESIPTEALDSIVAAYLSLAKEAGLPLVEQELFNNPQAVRDDVYAAVTAIRFHGTDEKIIPRERLQEVFRKLLDRPEYAELVIPDLARWEDWSVLDQLVTLFKTADKNAYFIRTPVVQYLAVCPLPEAKARLEELKQIDPQAVARGLFFAQRSETESAEVAPPAAAPAAVVALNQAPPAAAASTTRSTETESDGTIIWSLAAAGLAMVALVLAFLAYRRKNHLGRENPHRREGSRTGAV